jgi:hypothetical protein
MRNLDSLLRLINPYYHAFRQMREIELEQEQYAERNGCKVPEVRMFIKKDCGEDPRRYNIPQIGEIAVVFVSENGEPPVDRDMVIYPKKEERSFIKSLSANCDPMVYPILFPHGEPGWKPGMAHVESRSTEKRNKITLLQFYSYKLSVRAAFNQLHSAGKLFQQYVVDAYVKTEGNNLNWIKNNQANLRVDLYQGLMDHVNNISLNHNLRPGKVVILPSSFTVSYVKVMSIIVNFKC